MFYYNLFIFRAKLILLYYWMLGDVNSIVGIFTASLASLYPIVRISIIVICHLFQNDALLKIIYLYIQFVML